MDATWSERAWNEYVQRRKDLKTWQGVGEKGREQEGRAEMRCESRNGRQRCICRSVHECDGAKCCWLLCIVAHDLDKLSPLFTTILICLAGDCYGTQKKITGSDIWSIILFYVYLFSYVILLFFLSIYKYIPLLLYKSNRTTSMEGTLAAPK